MAVTAIVSVKFKPELITPVKEWLKRELTHTRVAPGCLGLEVVQNQDDGLNLLFISKWNHRSDHERYLGWRTERGDMAQMVQMSSEPPMTLYLDETDL